MLLTTRHVHLKPRHMLIFLSRSMDMILEVMMMYYDHIYAFVVVCVFSWQEGDVVLGHRVKDNPTEHATIYLNAFVLYFIFTVYIIASIH